MKHKMKLVSTASLCMSLLGVNAQEAILTSGQEASGTGGFSSSSMGQVFYTTNSGSSGTVAQGVQQAFEISVTSGIDEIGINLKCAAYPNPTIDNVTLTIEDNASSNLSYDLFDFQGKKIGSDQVTSENTVIDMSELPSAIYFLKVAHNNSVIKTFKIIKNQ